MINVGDISKPSVSRDEIKSKLKKSSSSVKKTAPVEPTGQTASINTQQDSNQEHQASHEQGETTKQHDEAQINESPIYDNKGKKKAVKNLDFKA